MKCIVVKIGTKVLSNTDGTLDLEFLNHIVEQIVQLRNDGIQIVLVTSGAVGAGRSMISLNEIKTETVQKQVFAAVGQVKLMATYSGLFKEHNYVCAQVLVTKEDFRDEQHYLNMKNCFEGLLSENVIPVVNENDVVAITELMFTDNDELAGLVAKQLSADRLIIMTGTDGVLDDKNQTIPVVTSLNSDIVATFVKPVTGAGGRGGMTSKFSVAEDLVKNGVLVSIVKGKKRNVLLNVMAGEKEGTQFVNNI